MIFYNLVTNPYLKIFMLLEKHYSKHVLFDSIQLFRNKFNVKLIVIIINHPRVECEPNSTTSHVSMFAAL